MIALPRAAPADSVVRHQSPGARPRPLAIFLVEDNEDSARSLADLLELDGHTVEIFPEPDAALEALREWQPALLICDIGLPGMTGYDFIRDRPANRLGRTALRGGNDRVRAARGPPAGGLRRLRRASGQAAVLRRARARAAAGVGGAVRFVRRVGTTPDGWRGVGAG